MLQRIESVVLIVLLLFTTGVSGEWEWRFPLPQGDNLHRVITLASGEVLILSEFNQTLLLKDGEDWKRIDTGLSRFVKNVWGLSTDELFAIGHWGEIYHYDGTVWMPMDSGTDDDSLVGIWGSSSNHVLVVGGDRDDFGPVIRRWDGSVWTEMEQNLQGALSDVFGFSDSNVYVAGSVLAHWDGSDWTPEQTLPDISYYHEIYGSGSDDLFVTVTKTGGLDNWGIIHFDGVVWSEILSDQFRSINQIWSLSPGTLYAAADLENNDSAVIYWDGNQWSTLYTESAGYYTSYLDGVGGPSPEDIYAVGFRGKIVHYDGLSWSELSTGFRGDIENFYVLDSTHIYAVGTRISIPWLDSTFLFHDETGWNYRGLGSDNYWTDIWACDSENVYISGYDDWYNGKIAHFNGSSIDYIHLGIQERIRRIWASSSEDIYVLTGDNDIRRFNGTTWDLIQLGYDYRFDDIHGTGPEDVWIVGGDWPDTVCIHWDGNTWREYPVNGSGSSRKLWGLTSDRLFLRNTWQLDVNVYRSSLFRWNGSDWLEVNIDPDNYMVNLWGHHETDMYGVYITSGIYHWNGYLWQPISGKNMFNTGLLAGTPDGTVFAAGYDSIHEYQGIPPVGVQLEMPGYVSPGDTFGISARLFNNDVYTPGTPLFFILDILGEYWFWPDWSHYKDGEGTVSWETLDLMPGETDVDVLQPFTWPDTGDLSMRGLRFWGGMTDPDITEILGVLDVVEWSFGL